MESMYFVFGLISYVALISVVFLVAESIASIKEMAAEGFRKLWAGARGGLFYVVNGRKRYI